MDRLKNNRTNKGLSFTLEERQTLGVHGLLPPAFVDQDAQAETVLENIRRIPDGLDKYTFLMSLLDRLL